MSDDTAPVPAAGPDPATALGQAAPAGAPVEEAPRAAPEAERRSGWRRLRRRYSGKESLLAAVLLAPSIAVFVVFFYSPFINLAWWGTFESRRGGAFHEQVGLSQYREELASDEFRSGLWHTVQFILYTVPPGLILGILLAVAANRKLRGIKIFHTIFASTLASSTAVASVIFFFLLNPVVGVFEVDLLGNSDTAMLGAALPSIWSNLGLAFIIVLAGLQAIPEEVMEAATLDGYGPARRLFRITLPLISPVLLFLLVVLVINGFQAFAQIDLVTGGGPAGATETLVFKINRLVRPDNIGIGGVFSVGLFFVTLVATFLQFVILERRVHYGN